MGGRSYYRYRSIKCLFEVLGTNKFKHIGLSRIRINNLKVCNTLDNVITSFFSLCMKSIALLE